MACDRIFQTKFWINFHEYTNKYVLKKKKKKN